MGKRRPQTNLKEDPRIVELDSADDVDAYTSEALGGGRPNRTRTTPQHETLYDQVDRLNRQRQQQQQQQQQQRQHQHRSFLQPTVDIDVDNDPELGATGRLMFQVLDYTQFLIPLLSVHLVLNVLVRVQYAQDVEAAVVLWDSLLTVPVLLTLHWVLHGWRATAMFKVAAFVASVAIGSYLLYAANDEGYYFVMKRAPPLGTIWVWLFVEMDWHWSAASLLLVAAYMKFKRYEF